MDSYQSLVDRLYQLNTNNKVKLGLDTCEQLHAQMGAPSESYKIIHVAGTNGKGSVCTKIAGALQLAGYRVGLFTSPHISSYRERIRVDGEMISEDEVRTILYDLFNRGTSATFFEITTMMALKYFADQKVDYAVLETGLGGRLDATNIVHPKIVVITSIGLDHQQILGETVEEIAGEKAGIIKSNVPTIIGPKVPLEIIEQKTQQVHSELFQVRDIHPTFDAENKAIASAVLDKLQIDTKYILEGINIQPPCREEKITSKTYGVDFVLDVAHNPIGLQRLLEKIKLEQPDHEIYVVVGFSKGKDVMSCVQILDEHCCEISFVTGVGSRCLPLEDIKEAVGTSPKYTYYPKIQDAMERAVEISKDRRVINLVCGSFFIMHEIREILGLDDESDIYDMNEKM
ncbi:MAG: folylpolyglutamate synthase/dihydrofolate synthase family protein [Chlamydiota bacterium]|nr:folylpolyglutamate synthase/dihydrofolate synthase family protein [Chlamydiota bacterium]